jgi:hypothetical protein
MERNTLYYEDITLLHMQIAYVQNKFIGVLESLFSGFIPTQRPKPL